MKTVFLLLVTLFWFQLFGQIGGEHSFALLDLTYHARGNGLGGNFISAKDDDINMGISNPSLLNQTMHGGISVSNAFHAGKINYGMLSYGHSLGERHMIAASVRYVAYGKMDRTDKNGLEMGTFSPFEYVLGVGYGYQFNPRISVGANFNLIGSHLEAYSSYGMSLDLGGTYFSEDENFLVTALFKNVGFQFNAYSVNRYKLPANFQLALSYKLSHAPFRFSLLMHHLNKWNLAYNDPNWVPTKDLLTGEIVPVKRPGFFEQLAQHFSYQLEVLATKNIHFRLGFDYYTRKSMRLESKPGLSGFSAGFGLKFKKFGLDYGFTAYSKAGFNNVVTFSTNITKIKL
ncbi:MAG TPA: type IX secretion system protein PorQ [Taishania sp.]|nr:type IX secretion system protein PorQ [Taishania sp.]